MSCLSALCLHTAVLCTPLLTVSMHALSACKPWVWSKTSCHGSGALVQGKTQSRLLYNSAPLGRCQVLGAGLGTDGIRYRAPTRRLRVQRELIKNRQVR